MIRARFAFPSQAAIDPVFFDATPWFRTAREHEVVELVRDGWRGKSALRLALGLRGTPGYGGLVRAIAEISDCPAPPSVQIDFEDAMHWLHFNRRGMFDEAMAADRSDPAMRFRFPDGDWPSLPRRHGSHWNEQSIVLRKAENESPGILLPLPPSVYLVEEDGTARNAEVVKMLEGVLPGHVATRLRERISGAGHLLEHSDLLFEAGFVAALEDGIPPLREDADAMRRLRRLFSTTSRIHPTETVYGVGSWQSGAAMAACLTPPPGTTWSERERSVTMRLEAALARLEAGGIVFGENDPPPTKEEAWLLPESNDWKIGWIVEEASGAAGDFALAIFSAFEPPQHPRRGMDKRSDFPRFLAKKEREAVFLPLFYEGAGLDDLVAIGERETGKSEDDLIAFHRTLDALPPEDRVRHALREFAPHLRPQYRDISPEDVRRMAEKAIADHPVVAGPFPEEARDIDPDERHRAPGLG